MTIAYAANYGTTALGVDPYVNNQKFPAGLLAAAPLTTTAFLNTVEETNKLTNVVGIIEMDDFNAEDSMRVIQINIRRYD
jgi:hypothetical protein